MIVFRGKTHDGSMVIGNLATKNVDGTEEYYISNSVGVPYAFKVEPETLSVGFKDIVEDIHDKTIFASYKINGKMTKGGDVLKATFKHGETTVTALNPDASYRYYNRLRSLSRARMIGGTLTIERVNKKKYKCELNGFAVRYLGLEIIGNQLEKI